MLWWNKPPDPVDIEFDPNTMKANSFGCVSTPISKDLIEDTEPIQQWLQDQIDYATGAKERPPRVEPVITPIEPTRVFTDATEALRKLVDAGFECYEGICDDRTCFYCGSQLNYEPHDSTCSYIAAKILLDKLDGKE